jgi:hypothetical protein
MTKIAKNNKKIEIVKKLNNLGKKIKLGVYW